MASFQKSQDIDVLNVRQIFARGDSNTTLPGNSVLLTDGHGGTTWVPMSEIQQTGLTFNTIITTQSTFTSGPSKTSFSILDGDNAGLIPTGLGTEVQLYAKAFGQVAVPGASPICAFDTVTGIINSNVTMVPQGTIQITTDPTSNTLRFYSPDNAVSSMSTMLENVKNLNTTLSNSIQNFNSPFSTFIYQSISSFSTSLGQSIETSINTNQLQISGTRQPFIQYGSGILITGGTQVTLGNPYSNSNYIIQLTYTGTTVYTTPLKSTSITATGFTVIGNSTGNFHWTTYG